MKESILKQFQSEVEQAFAGFRDYEPEVNFNLKKYIGTGLQFKGLTIPMARSIYKNGYSFSQEAIEIQLIIWDYIWKNASLYEAKMQALFFINQYYKKIDQALLWETVKHWTPQIDNWAHSDELSRCYSHLLESLGSKVYKQLAKWNRSKLPWERRQSLVSLLFYRRHRKVFLKFDEYICLIENLLLDKDYFVQKGIGWTLRELFQQFEEEAYEYMLSRAKQISSTAYYACAEKMNTEQKELFKSLRKG
ncbi:MAG: DNA alkylation repair protein [Bacteroidetes bacterium]|nr:DNA alkylation repair protein [Bacteroidota bacterium]